MCRLHKQGHEPLFVVKNGSGELAVMSIETYKELPERVRTNPVIRRIGAYRVTDVSPDHIRLHSCQFFVEMIE